MASQNGIHLPRMSIDEALEVTKIYSVTELAADEGIQPAFPAEAL